MMMNKKALILLPILLLTACLIFIFKNFPIQRFYLEEKYYGNKKFKEIKAETLENMIDKKESFALFIYQPACVTSSDFEAVLNKFVDENPITIYMITFENMKSTKLHETIKYYPSFALFNKGELVDSLDASSEEDLKYYSNKDDFKTWITNHVILKEENKSSQIEYESEVTQNEVTENETTTISKEDTKLEEITYDKNKINIYMFWGSTCPHCKAEFAFFDEIKSEYAGAYNLYTFEVWENEENKKLMDKFAEALDENPKGVPYTIIGDESFIGFGDSDKQKFKDLIKNNHQNSKDIYFEKIKSPTS